jgi:PPOX class probable F420-dependent enzyme
MTNPVVDLGAEKFLRLTTFRKTGVPVHTAVWVVVDGDRLLVTTGADSGKVKRLRHTSRIELTPCSQSGKVADGAIAVEATASVDPSAGTRSRLDELLLQKYKLAFRAIRAASKLSRSNESIAIVIAAA